ncbi:MarR family transcriptional regulator [Amycolatopsis sp. QT-25]|uniref:MarR family winged helix-turn-helix transcriptional regulator n=1 Tax=Amycolatopsis sp. QT-25 TaxID=3034022 RepID=UPI0023EDD63E|nr:MarR family transcriptional regulator [Amycolatopsis sp. QT-25]WET82478.1 MarR family transcriptional regulator [Amycolatopsis sp. QT-25]
MTPSMPVEPPTPLSYEVIQLLVEMSARLSRNFAARAAELNLTAAEGKVLLALEPKATLSMRGLARKLGYDASNLTGIIDKLEDHGLVGRHTDRADRRIKNIMATDEGARVRDGLAQRLREDAGPVSALTEPELHELRALLVRAMDSNAP